MKKFFLMLLAATTLSLGFTACNDDDEKTPETPDKPDTSKVIDFPDYASAIDMNLNTMLQKYGEPEMAFGGFYMYTFEEGNVEGLVFMVNEENNKVYSVAESLKVGAYKAEDIQAYFASKYKFYGKEEYEADEENEIEASVICTYGNTEKKEDATLVITVTNNTHVSYENPKNVPEEKPSTVDFSEMTPVEAVTTFYGRSIEDILDVYEGAFMEVNGMYMAVVEDNDYFNSIALAVAENVVTSVIIFFEDGQEEETILDYYRQQGYNVTATGEEDEEGFKQYIISNGVVTIVYQGYMGTATANLDSED